jgi:hypothetical protein
MELALVVVGNEDAPVLTPAVHCRLALTIPILPHFVPTITILKLGAVLAAAFRGEIVTLAHSIVTPECGCPAAVARREDPGRNFDSFGDSRLDREVIIAPFAELVRRAVALVILIRIPIRENRSARFISTGYCRAVR